ncbi:uncharacterized protein LOC141886446 isoform X1 [Acropora palmata]|uniref:uncharacterized protein LOC141886446 isoform X1 n=2 Tax=Acropora palmata TaxID=6131 RepID=UPI003DA111EE
MAEFVGIPKAAMRNRKRSEKRIKARIQPSMGNGVKVEAIEMKDPSAVLRQQFQEAKNKKDHERAARLRQELWITQDNAAILSMAEVEELRPDISSVLIKKLPGTGTERLTHAPTWDSQASGLSSPEKIS